MKKLLLQNLRFIRKRSYYIVLILVCYHVIFGFARFWVDLTYPNGWYDTTIVAFGEKPRVYIVSERQEPNKWHLSDTQPEWQKNPQNGTVSTILDENVYDYELEMGWFYQYKTLYVYGGDGFWIFQNDPYHIKLLLNKNIPEKEAQYLDETMAEYNIFGDQFSVVHSESDLTEDEKQAFARVKEKAQPRIKLLQEQGSFL